MISKITGRIAAVHLEYIGLGIGAFEYEVLIAEFTRRHVQAKVGQDITLYTIEYLEGNPMQGRMTPRLLGFLSEVEREFFELFCSVDGVGVKKALRAMTRPVNEVAELIENQDLKGLSGLPGVGAATAERIVAKLRRKMAKFALMIPRELPGGGTLDRDVMHDAFDALRALGHSEQESRRLVETVLEGKKNKFKDVNEMLLAIFQQRGKS